MVIFPDDDNRRVDCVVNSEAKVVMIRECPEFVNSKSAFLKLYKLSTAKNLPIFYEHLRKRFHRLDDMEQCIATIASHMNDFDDYRIVITKEL